MLIAGTNILKRIIIFAAMVGLVWAWFATNKPFRNEQPSLIPVTIEMLDTVRQYPEGEQYHRLRDVRRGRVFPMAPTPAEYCRQHICSKFPHGYFTVHKGNESFYFPLSRANQSGFPNEIIMPAFDYRATDIFEVRNSDDKIVKRISMDNGDNSPYWFDLVPFIEENEQDMLPLTTQLKMLRVFWQSRGYYSDFIPPAAMFQPDQETLIDSGLRSYDDDFWLVSETEKSSGGAYGGACCFYNIQLITKKPVLQGRRAYISCGGGGVGCSILSISNVKDQDTHLRINISVFRRGTNSFAFTQNYGTRSNYQSFEEWLNAYGGYSLIEYDGFGLMDLINLTDRMIEKTKTYDPNLSYIPQESEKIERLRAQILEHH